MITKPKIIPFGTAVWGVDIKGDPKNPEKASFRVRFPGGDVDVVRTSNNDYWVHVRINHPDDDMVVVKEAAAAHLVDARLDIKNMPTSRVNIGDFENPDLYHLAVRIKRDNKPED